MRVNNGRCCVNKPHRKKEARLTFYRNELLYDVENCAHVEGDVMTGGNDHARHQLQDIAQEGNIDRVTRVLNLVHMECVEALYPYTQKELPDREVARLDDKHREPEKYVITLSLPEDFSATTLRLLRDTIHEYMVCRVLADWIGITYPEGSVKWAQKAAAHRERMRGLLMSRTGMVRRPLKPW